MNMKKYRITKYDPRYRDGQGRYLRDEWTSWCDIGRYFEDRVFTKDDYITWENRYIQAVEKILRDRNIEELHIVDLEIPDVFSNNTKSLAEKELNLSEGASELYEMIVSGKRAILANDISDVMELLLRDFIWCRLCHGSETEIYTGYDYYMYYNGTELTEPVIKNIADTGLFIECEEEKGGILA